ncbi:MAG: hypothetical protein GY782_08210 [Gammaproteobacteria bacterium]|nr:hypothetical protein [Gammaproteobacteria bacterium]
MAKKLLPAFFGLLGLGWALTAVAVPNNGMNSQAIPYTQLPGFVTFMKQENNTKLIYTWANDNLTKDAKTNIIGKENSDPSISWNANARQFDSHDWAAIHSNSQKVYIESTSTHGKKQFYLAYINPTRDQQGNVTGISKIVLEVTPELLKTLNKDMAMTTKTSY